MKGMITMIPTRNTITAMIDELNEEQFKKVAVYVKAVQEEDMIASSAEVANLTSRFNKKYEKAFRALAQ